MSTPPMPIVVGGMEDTGADEGVGEGEGGRNAGAWTPRPEGTSSSSAAPTSVTVLVRMRVTKLVAVAAEKDVVTLVALGAGLLPEGAMIMLLLDAVAARASA